MPLYHICPLHYAFLRLPLLLKAFCIQVSEDAVDDAADLTMSGLSCMVTVTTCSFDAGLNSGREG